MMSQVLRRTALRLGRCLLAQNRQIVSCTHSVKNVQPKVVVPQIARCMSTQKFEAFNVQDTEDFKQRVIGSSTPVIVDFHATWCGPCKVLGPRLESIIATKEGKVHLAKIDVDDNADLAMEYGVQSVPTVLGIKNGKVLDQFIGLQDDDKLKTFVEKLLN